MLRATRNPRGQSARNQGYESTSQRKFPDGTQGIRPVAGEPRAQEPVVTQWENNDEVDPNAAAGTQAAPAGEDSPIIVTEHEVSAADRKAHVAALLGRRPAAEEDEPVAARPKVEAETDDVKAESVAAKIPATPRERLDALTAEKQRLALERQLTAERTARLAAEEKFRKGTLIEAAEARGLTRAQALEEVMGDATLPANRPAPNPVDNLDARLARIEAREAAADHRENIARIDEWTKDLPIEVTRATKGVSVEIDAGGGKTERRIMSGHELVMATAETLWRQAGADPSADRRQFVEEAAGKVEESLIAQRKPEFEAYAAKGGSKPKPGAAPKARAPAPALGTRNTNNGPAERPAALPDDIDERKSIVKTRFFKNG